MQKIEIEFTHYGKAEAVTKMTIETDATGRHLFGYMLKLVADEFIYSGVLCARWNGSAWVTIMNRVSGEEMETDLVQQFLSLPGFVVYEGREFFLEITNNGTNDMRLCYTLNEAHGEYYNPLLKKKCNFLLLMENIGDEYALNFAMCAVKEFLLNHKIISP